MRTPTSRAATSAFRALTRDHPPSITAHVSRAPYLCAACRAAILQRPQPQYPSLLTRRTLSTTTRCLNNPSTGSSSSSSSASASTSAAAATPSPAPQQRTHYTLFPKTFPSGPPPASPFLPDLRALRAEFLALQSQTHPDRFAGSAKAAAEASSAALNEAYRTLGDPLRHANYLLAVEAGIDTEDEGAKLEDAGLLMEVMEAREGVDAADSEAALAPLMEENAARIEASVAALDALVGARRWEEAAREAVRLRYWRNVEESIRGWEKGQGGGVLHH